MLLGTAPYEDMEMKGKTGDKGGISHALSG